MPRRKKSEVAVESANPNAVVYVVRDENGAIVAAYDSLEEVDTDGGTVGEYTLQRTGTVQTEKTFKESE